LFKRRIIMNWMTEAREIAAHCWCDPETKDREMDTVLAEAVARRIAVWMETAAQNEQNADYYRKLVVRCGKAIGLAAYTCDDGSISEDVLCDKVPELFEKVCGALKAERVFLSFAIEDVPEQIVRNSDDAIRKLIEAYYVAKANRVNATEKVIKRVDDPMKDIMERWTCGRARASGLPGKPCGATGEAMPTIKFGKCVWDETEDGDWESSCGRVFTLFIDGPRANDYRYCPGCGRPIVERERDPFEEWDED